MVRSRDNSRLGSVAEAPTTISAAFLDGPQYSDEFLVRAGASSQETHHGVSSQYESLEYQPIDNLIYQQESRTPKFQHQLIRESVNRWVVCFVIGVLTALVACFIDFMVIQTTDLKFNTIRSLFEFCSERGDNCLGLPLLSWWAFNAAFVGVASALVVFFAGPVAAGSGIPQIKCYLNGVMIPGVVRLKTLVAKAAGVACSVAGGLSVGKEGPMIHSGAVVAAGVSQGRCISIPFDFGLFQSFRNDREKRDFVSAGAAAGVAAAFGAPIGGVLFALEEGASFWNQSLTWRIFFSSMVSSFTLSAVLSVLHGKPGDLSWQGLANFGAFTFYEAQNEILIEEVNYNWWELVFFILIGGMGGLSGALFNHINLKLTIFRTKYLTAPWQRFLEAMVVAVVSGTAAFMMIFLIDDCQPLSVNRNNTLDPLQLWCPDGEYNAVAEIFFRSPEEAVKSLFHAPSGSYHPVTLIVFALVYFLLSTWTYGLSVPSGLFIPTLLTGAAWGRLVGMGLEMAIPSAHIDPGKYALAGAAAQLGGVVRMTISLCAIIIEATHNITFGLPIMLILMVAKWVGDIFNEGLYDIHIELADVPILGWDPPKMANNISALSVMHGGNVETLKEVDRVGRVYDLLKSCSHHAFPIVDQVNKPTVPNISNSPMHGRLKGMVRRSQLIVMLKNRHFSKDRAGTEVVEGWTKIGTQDFMNAYPKYNVVMDHITLSEEDRSCFISLEGAMWDSPYRVPDTASLSQVFTLFRGLGLRALPVVDENNYLLGIITRKDIARYKDEWEGSKYVVRELPIVE